MSWADADMAGGLGEDARPAARPTGTPNLDAWRGPEFTVTPMPKSRLPRGGFGRSDGAEYRDMEDRHAWADAVEEGGFEQASALLKPTEIANLYRAGLISKAQAQRALGVTPDEEPEGQPSKHSDRGGAPTRRPSGPAAPPPVRGFAANFKLGMARSRARRER